MRSKQLGQEAIQTVETLHQEIVKKFSILNDAANLTNNPVNNLNLGLQDLTFGLSNSGNFTISELNNDLNFDIENVYWN